MKRILSITFLFIAATLMSCGDSSMDASSTPIDSTNLNGTAPASYDAMDPAEPDHPRYEGQWDTGIQAGAGTAADSNTDRLGH